METSINRSYLPPGETAKARERVEVSVGKAILGSPGRKLGVSSSVPADPWPWRPVAVRGGAITVLVEVLGSIPGPREPC